MVEKSLTDKLVLLFSRSIKASEDLMKSRKKEDKIKGINLFLKITKEYRTFSKNNPVSNDSKITQEEIDKEVDKKLGELLADARAKAVESIKKETLSK